MSEISGMIVLKASDKTVKSCLHQFDEEVSSDVLEHLFEAANVDSEQMDFSPEEDLEEGYLSSNSVTRSGQYTIIEPFGEEWVKVLEVLQRGKGLEFWAHIQNEYGEEYFIVSTEAQSLWNSVDLEEGEEVDEIEQAWRAAVPTELQDYFDEDIDLD